MKRHFLTIAILLSTLCANAQVGEYRNRFSVGAGAGYALNRMTFQPEVMQHTHGGLSLGITGRYTAEKYFSTLCAVQAEVNITQLGWKEKLQTIDGAPVINPETNEAEHYQRDITYIQIPVFAHLSWGKEHRGVNAFVNLGPQIGFMIGEKTDCNYTTPFTSKIFPRDGEQEVKWSSKTGRASYLIEQESMPVENKLDFGIALGAGIEADIKHVGRFNLEGRYYYGLGNIYGDSKRDFFGKSSHSTIYIRLSYLRDI